MLRATLDKYQFVGGDYGRTITFFLYDEATSPYSLTGYTVTAEVLSFNKGVSIAFATTPDPDQTGNRGKGTFAFSASQNLTVKGLQWIRFKLEKSGELTYSQPVKVLVV